MTDRERLEEIKNSYLQGIHRLFGTSWVSMPKEDSDWLINRVEELELEVNDWRSEVQKWQKNYKELEESYLKTKELLHSTISENKRLTEKSIKYRELLSDIANLAYYKEQDEEYYESLLKQVILFARYTLEG